MTFSTGVTGDGATTQFLLVTQWFSFQARFSQPLFHVLSVQARLFQLPTLFLCLSLPFQLLFRLVPREALSFQPLLQF